MKQALIALRKKSEKIGYRGSLKIYVLCNKIFGRALQREGLVTSLLFSVQQILHMPIKAFWQVLSKRMKYNPVFIISLKQFNEPKLVIELKLLNTTLTIFDPNYENSFDYKNIKQKLQNVILYSKWSFCFIFL